MGPGSFEVLLMLFYLLQIGLWLAVALFLFRMQRGVRDLSFELRRTNDLLEQIADKMGG